MADKEKAEACNIEKIPATVVLGVPKTVANEKSVLEGSVPEAHFLAGVLPIAEEG